MHHCPHPELIADLLADRLGDAATSRWQQLYAGLPRPGEAEVTGLGDLLDELAPAASA